MPLGWEVTVFLVSFSELWRTELVLCRQICWVLTWLIFVFLCWGALLKIAELFRIGFLNRVLNSVEGLLWPPQLQVKILKFLSLKSFSHLKSENTQSFILGMITVFSSLYDADSCAWYGSNEWLCHLRWSFYVCFCIGYSACNDFDADIRWAV